MNILLVNPFSSTKYLSDFFKSTEHKTIALYTTDANEITEYFRPDPSYFDKQIFINLNDNNNIEEILKPYAIDFVINGTENYTNITDMIANKLTPNYANDSKTSILRMDKFHMHQHLAKSKLNYIKQYIFNCNKDKLDNFKLNHNITFPCFLKPLYGLASYFASKINSFEELQQKLDLFTHRHENTITTDSVTPKIKGLELLICDYIDGDEYFIDSFSYKGKHYISSIQKYTKVLTDNTPIYQYAEIVKDQQTIEKLTIYTREVLTALGNNFGFGHTEIKINTKDNKPVLIEFNPRISGGGGIGNIICKYADLNSQPELLNIILTNPAAAVNLEKIINPQHNCMWIILFNWSGKHVPDISAKLNQFKTVVFIKQLKFGDVPTPNLSTHLLSTMGIVILSSDDLALLRNDINQILTIDKLGWE
jgi:biotin carboxylase